MRTSPPAHGSLPPLSPSWVGVTAPGWPHAGVDQPLRGRHPALGLWGLSPPGRSLPPRLLSSGRPLVWRALVRPFLLRPILPCPVRKPLRVTDPWQLSP